MTDTNPYRPPEAELGTRRVPGRYRPLITISRVLVGLWGLFILAGPSRTGPNPAYHHGQILAKALGAILFLVAVFPIGKHRTQAEPRAEVSEDL
jgi:hypothetical protein